ncbi:MAG: O-antigen ligase family protein [Bacteroidota bacterium]|nr:O-antigen ligase family protein [Bacteroidota bacterium]
MGGINNKKNLYLFGIHAFITFISVYSSMIGMAWGALILVFGVYHIINNRNENNEAALYAAYFMALEVVLRVNKGSLSYEMGKYGVIIFLLTGLLFQQKPHFIPRQFIIFLLLLIPAISMVEMGDIDLERKTILFNLSGPVCLAISAMYFYKRPIDKETLYKIFLYIMLPIFSLGIILFLKTPDFSTVKFTADSNASLSGGFGPNQVSTILGLGIFIGAMALILGYTLTSIKLLDIAIILFLTLRGLLTFSRGGVVAAVMGLGIALFFILKQRKDKKLIQQVFIGSFVVIIAGFGVWSYTNELTGGALSIRYQGRSMNDPNKVSLTTGRIDIMETELEAFYAYPILGTGVGMGRIYRINHGGADLVAHTEYTRLIGEHGIYGIIALLIMLFTPLSHFFKLSNDNKYFFASFIVIALFTMFHGAMRLAMPGFMYGISFIYILSRNKPKPVLATFPIYTPPHALGSLSET